MKKKQLLLFILLSVLLQLVIAPLGGAWSWTGHNVKFFSAAILYTALTFFILHKSKGSLSTMSIVLILIVPILLPIITGFGFDLFNDRNIIDRFSDTYISWPSTLAQLFSVAVGYFLFKVKFTYKIVIAIVWIGFSFWVMDSGYNLYMNKFEFGNFTGKINEVAPEFVFTDFKNDSISNEDLKDSFVVLDFWGSSCGQCKAEMPKFQELFDNYGKSGEVLFYSVNNPLRNDTIGQAQYTLNSYHYNFPNLFSSVEVSKKFLIKVFPTYIILESNKIIYQGRITGIEKIIKNR